MIRLIAGASHTGKTVLAQQCLERYGCPFLSIDHLKMGLIRSGQTALTPYSDDAALTAYLWPIVREMIKTAIENRQDLTVEGCYIPFDWEKDFDETYRQNIRYVCLVLSETYIQTHFSVIRAHANDAEARIEEDCTPEQLMQDNRCNLALCRQHGCRYVLVEDLYPTDMLHTAGL